MIDPGNNIQRKLIVQMVNQTMLVLIVSSSGSLRSGLLALTTTIPQISAVLVADNIDSALTMIEDHQPVLIILELSLYKVKEVIKQIKTRWEYVHLIAIVEDMALKMEAQASGADHVLIQGFPAQKLISIVEHLIEIRETNLPVQKSLEKGKHVEEVERKN